MVNDCDDDRPAEFDVLVDVRNEEADRDDPLVPLHPFDDDEGADVLPVRFKPFPAMEVAADTAFPIFIVVRSILSSDGANVGR